MPSSSAPAAPGNPTTASVCPVKLWRRSTMNQPMAPARTATMVPAPKALHHERVVEQLPHVADEVPGERGIEAAAAGDHGWWRWSERLGLSGLADDDQPPVGRGEDLDRRPVEARQRLAGDDLARWARGGGPVGDVDRPGRGTPGSGSRRARPSGPRRPRCGRCVRPARRRPPGSAGRGCPAARRAAAAEAVARAPGRSAAAAAHRRRAGRSGGGRTRTPRPGR